MKNKFLLALIGLMLPLMAVAQEVSLSATNVAMHIGEYGRLTATVTPTAVTVNWSSSDATVATVTNAGVINAVGVGEATITAACGEKSSSCSVTVTPRDGDVNADGKHSVSDVTYTAGYIMETLAETNTFYKEVADIDKDGMVIVPDLTSIVDLVLDADNVPEAPQNVMATGRINTVLVTWDAVAGADSYIVYRSADGEDFEPIAFNVTEQSFVDEEPLDGTNYYKVGVVSGYAKSELSEVVNAALFTEIPNNEIWYVTEDGSLIDIYNCKVIYGNEPFDKNIISHTYENGFGKIVCDGDITSINDRAFNDFVGDKLTELLLPNSIENFGWASLYSLGNVSELHIPDNLKNNPYNDYVFGPKSRKLRKFTGNNVSEDGRCLIFDGVLRGFAPAGLTEYSLPNEIEVIGNYSLAWCPNLKKITFNEGLKELGYFILSECSVEEITIPNSLESASASPFEGCPGIKRFNGPKKFVSDDHLCFFGYDRYLGGCLGPLLKTLSYFAGQDLVEYTIPEGVEVIATYSFDFAKKLEKLTLPNSLKKIGSRAFEKAELLKELHGPNTTSDHRAFIFEGELFYVLQHGLTEYTIPNGVKYLGHELFGRSQNLEVINMTDEVIRCNKNGFAFSDCPKLKQITISARMEELSDDPFMYSNNLETVYMRAPIPPYLGWVSPYNQFENLTIYVPKESLEFYLSDPSWEPYYKFIKPYNYTDIPEELKNKEHITSDYSKNGEVQKLQTATVGKGIDIVFMGEGFVDKDMDEGGKYETVMIDAMEKFFSIEPYTTMRERFNVYSVKVVSKNDKWGDDARHAIMQHNDVAFKYASDIPGINHDHLYVNVIYNAPTDGSWYGRSYTTMYYNDGSYVAYCMEGVNNVLIHEAAGHGFAKLADEYVEFDATFNDYYGLDQMHEMNWYQNEDYRNTPEDVYWNKFLSDSRYEGQVGIYEGAFTYSNGVYRPTENSMMRYNDSPFNAPSREAIYKAIMRESEGDGWVYNYEDFVAYDEINRQAEANAPRRAPSRQEIEEYEKHHKAPVIVKGGWRDAAKKEETAPQSARRQMPTPMMASGHTPLPVDVPIINNEQPKTEKTPVRPKYSKVSTELSVFEMSEAQTADNVAAIDVSVKSGYIATQFDVMLPECVSMAKAELIGKNAETHKMTYRRLDNGRVRVVIFSMDNAEMTDNLLRLTLQGNGEILLTNALVNEILPDGKIVEKAATSISAMVNGNATGISSAESSRQNIDGMYNLSGQKVNADYKGIVIKKGTKVVK